MKKILWITTGGTICCIKGEKGLVPMVFPEQTKKMLEAIGIDISAVQRQELMNIDSTDICCDDMRKIGYAVNEGILSGYGGIVITHGTDTMAYTSAVLAKMLSDPPIPIIITGSQKPFFDDDSDGKSNLANAFAAAQMQYFKGVYVLFGDKIIAGSKAYKAYSQSFNAFISPDGYAGIISEGIITPQNTVSTKGDYRFDPDIDENVLLIKLAPCTKPDIIGYAVNSGYKGIVIEGYGCGGIPKRMLPEIKKAAAAGVRIMLISQCFYEGVFMDIYEVGRAAAECGVISGGKMTAEAALADMMYTIKKGGEKKCPTG
ncbi:MAG: asparaginase [Ruminococcus sp.]|nr:asparaginase [Ruminococcus sp.]